MLLMTVDHLRDFIVEGEPTDLSHGRFGFFLIRWVTHFCAPTFVFLAGLGAWLHGRKRGPAQQSRYLWSRGAVLIGVEVTVVGYCWRFFNTTFFDLQVIWVLGASMMLLGCVTGVRPRTTLLLGAGLIAAHNLLDGFHPSNLVWGLIHQPGEYGEFGILYPIVPWVGVMFCGYAFGHFVWEAPGRTRRMWLLAGGLTVAFVVVRGLNGYGEPEPWATRENGWMTVASFLNCTKYPPSLDYLLMTLGPMMGMLAALDGRRLPAALRPVLTLGRVPLFYYVAHLYLIEFAALLLAWAWTGISPITFLRDHGRWAAVHFGFGLGELCVGAALVAAALYYPCRWYDRLKSSRRHAWTTWF